MVMSGIATPLPTWCQMHTKSVSNRTVQAALGLAITVLLVAGTISCRGIAASGASDIWVRHSRDVFENLQNLRLEMPRVDSSYHGFVLLGDENSLQTYREAISRAERIETKVRSMTLDCPTQQRGIASEVRLADQKIRSAQSSMDMRRSKGEEAAGDSIRTGDGERIMGQFQDAVHQMEQEEQRFLVLRRHINDSLGHPTGDKLPQSVAKRLVDWVRGSDTVSHQRATSSWCRSRQ